MTHNEMVEVIAKNPEAQSKLDSLYELKLNGLECKWSVPEIIEAVYNKFCK